MRLGLRLLMTAAALQGCGASHLAVDAGDAAASDATNSTASSDSGHPGIVAPLDASNSTPEGGDIPCADAGPFFFRIAGDGPDETWQFECGNAPWTFPVAFRQFEGEGDGEGRETAAACGTLDAGTLAVSVGAFLVTAGTSDGGFVAYTDATGRAWSGQGEVTFDQWGAVGTAVEGSFAALVVLGAHSDAGATLSLSGSFRVCHAYDGEPAP